VGQGGSGGFSAIELIITATMIMGLASLSITAAVNQWRGEQTYAVAEELAGWIATVQRAARRGLRCDVTIAPNSGALASGDVLAQASQTNSGSLQNSCTAYSPMRIESVPAPAQFTVSPTSLSFSFTPRGTIANSSADPVVISLTNTAGGDVRCIRLDGLLGITRVGMLVGSTCQV
jgi:Tfp pilus assembly protein FimT